VSNQTASRRLQSLEDEGFIERELTSDGQFVRITDAGERVLSRELEDYRQIFDTEETTELTGTVTSGMGEGRHYISLSGYMSQFIERLGYEPFPGTLNLELTDRAQRERSAMVAGPDVPIDGWEDDERTFGPATCYPVELESGEMSDEEAHAIVPDRTHHDESQLEVIAPDRLRDSLELADGDELTIRVGGR